jgi:riboflavin kinase / FMN adenylyltransferase
MKVYQGLDQFHKLPYAVVTSGTFDGVHVGHRKILERLKEAARQNGGETVVITYWPHPRLILNPKDDSLRLISTIEEKIDLLREAGIDHLVILAFTKQFSQLSSEEFIQQVLIDKIGTRRLVIGYDHRFGKNREGSFDHLQQNAAQYGFEVEEIPRQDIDAVGVSSTKIRNALQEGRIHTANEYLGTYYSLRGKVVHGNKIGREIGYPTANLHIEETYKLIPADGVYACYVRFKHSSRYKAMMSIGLRPTVDNERTIEVNIFDFDEDIYGEELQVELVEMIRGIEKFSSMEALTQKLHEDKERSLQILQS